MIGSTGTEQIVIARFQDGRVLKGTTRDFGPNKKRFHLFVDGNETEESLEIPMGALKAVFFVKTYEGDPNHEASYDFDASSGHGRRMIVTFQDGETMAGYTMGYSPGKPGFFIVPADPDGNNQRVFVVTSATRKVEFAPVGAAIA